MAAPAKIIFGVLAACLPLALAGCVLRAKPTATTPAAVKPAAPSAPPAPVALSVPQTQVELPRQQPIDPDALAAENTQSVPTETPAVPRPQPPVRKTTPSRPETVAPPAAAPPAPEPARQQFQEIVSAADQKRLQESARNRKSEVHRILAQFKHPSSGQRTAVANILSLVSLSDEAEKRNDMRQADSLADRALILARDLQQHGK
jgi:hypothetical protein